MKKKIIVICGPTGIGKTKFAIDIAKKLNGEIISADSMQIYKYMDIGTAKPDKVERDLVPHHLIDFIEPYEEFDAGQYVAKADGIINDIYERSKIPVIVGGTGFYIKALLYGLFRDRNVDADVIKRLESEKNEKGSQELHRRLSILDPESASRIHPNDGFRIVRALEVVEVTGYPISILQSQHGFATQRYIPLKIGIYMDRASLYERIEKRVDMMIKQGFVEEVKGLISRGYSCNLKSMQSIGYRHICNFLHSRLPQNDPAFISNTLLVSYNNQLVSCDNQLVSCDNQLVSCDSQLVSCDSQLVSCDNPIVCWNETLRLLKRDTRHYAKRQLTWFRKDKDIIWLTPNATDKAQELIKKFLN